MKTRYFFTGVALLLAACSGAVAPPGQSLADNSLQATTIQTIKRFELARELNGEAGVIHSGMPKVLAVRVVQSPPPTRQAWREVWSVARTNGSVEYSISYVTREDIGGTDLKVTPMNMQSPVRATQ